MLCPSFPYALERMSKHVDLQPGSASLWLTLALGPLWQTVGMLLVYDHNGDLVSQTPKARSVGTTITLQDLFATLPVR